MSMQRAEQTTVVSRASDEQPEVGAAQALEALERLVALARGRLRDRVVEAPRSPRVDDWEFVGVTPAVPPRISSLLLEQRQVGAHALACLATEVEAGSALLGWADKRGGRLDRRIADAFVASAHRTAHHGVVAASCEVVPYTELEVGEEEVARALGRAPLGAWARDASTSDALQNLAESALDAGIGRPIGCDDDEAAAAERAALRELLAGPDVAGATVAAALARVGERGALDGGNEAAHVARSVALEEIGRGAPALGPAAADALVAAALLRAYGTPDQIHAHLDAALRGRVVCSVLAAERDVLELDFARARLDRSPDGRRLLNGRKAGGASALDAALAIVLARSDEALAGAEGLSFAIAVMPGAGAVTQADGSVHFEGLEVGDAGVLGGEEGRAGQQLEAAAAAGWFAIAALTVGVAQGALEASARCVRERLPGSAPLGRRPRVGSRLGQLIVATTAARRLVLVAARALDRGDGFAQAAMARLAASHAARAAALLHADVCGALSRPRPTELDAAARALSTAHGTVDDVAHALARRLLQ